MQLPARHSYLLLHQSRSCHLRPGFHGGTVILLFSLFNLVQIIFVLVHFFVLVIFLLVVIEIGSCLLMNQLEERFLDRSLLTLSILFRGDLEHLRKNISIGQESKSTLKTPLRNSTRAWTGPSCVPASPSSHQACLPPGASRVRRRSCTARSRHPPAPGECEVAIETIWAPH